MRQIRSTLSSDLLEDTALKNDMFVFAELFHSLVLVKFASRSCPQVAAH